MSHDDLARLAEDLHNRLMRGDKSATAKLAGDILPQVFDDLKRRRLARGRDEQVLFDALYDAFFKYTEKPSNYNPAKANFLAYLSMAAYRRLQNALKKERRLKSRERVVELGVPTVNTSMEDEIAEREETKRYLSLLAGKSIQEKISHLLPDPVDQKFCELMMDGERRTEAFAAVAGLSGAPKQVRTDVKRRKDRITKALERAGARLKHERRN